ncbi:RNA polymerase sigma-E factor [Rodentibacter pneumotropicus]|uniref:RNA polymerase sigma-E factor n=1 Tax=Rodentibacter pneumotropicus TaxID=758 RepID=A0A448MJ13_9PAST|nr:RNA polymerase sigma-E factor [Rodentibacter pneumotropicus]
MAEQLTDQALVEKVQQGDKKPLIYWFRVIKIK